MLTTALLVTLILVIIAELMNGWTDAPNVTATIVSTGVLDRKKALGLAVIGNVLGVFVLGQHVAKTISKDLIQNNLIDLSTLTAALISAIAWTGFAYNRGFAISKSHTLYAALGGAALAKGGLGVFITTGWIKILAGISISIFCGFILCFFFVKVLERFISKTALHAPWIRNLQIVTAFAVAVLHGANDGQKYMGVFVQALILGGVQKTYDVPFYVVIVCAITMGIGTQFGGWRIVKRTKEDFGVHLPYQGSVIEFSTALLLGLATRYGIPQSTTHTMVSSTVGAGSASRESNCCAKTTAKNSLYWVATFPVCGILAAILTKLITLF